MALQDFSIRLNQAMSAKNLSLRDLSEKTGINYEMVRRYSKGQAKPRNDKMKLLAQCLGVPITWLDYGEGEMVIEPQNTTLSQRVLKLVPDFAPDGSFIYKPHLYEVNLNTVICRQILDDSMDTFFKRGDFVFADTTVKPETGGYVIAQLEDNSEVVRRYKEYQDSTLGILQKELIVEDKEHFSDIKFSDSPFEIIGTIFEHKRFLGAGLKRLGHMAAENELAYLITQELERQKNTSD